MNNILNIMEEMLEQSVCNMLLFLSLLRKNSTVKELKNYILVLFTSFARGKHKVLIPTDTAQGPFLSLARARL